MADNGSYATFTVGAAAIVAGDLLITPAAAVVSTGVTVEPFGVAMDGAAISGTVNVCMSGRCKARASAAIVIGAKLMPAAAGEVTTHDDDAASVHIGYAMSAAGAANDTLWINFSPQIAGA